MMTPRPKLLTSFVVLVKSHENNVPGFVTFCFFDAWFVAFDLLRSDQFSLFPFLRTHVHLLNQLKQLAAKGGHCQPWNKRRDKQLNVRLSSLFFSLQHPAGECPAHKCAAKQPGID
jgi:hypothetical protein